jgi:alanine racemase
LTRLSWLEIDVEALSHNLRLTRQVAGGVDINAVVKADGYGHGAVTAARAFVGAGAARLCVATFDEALALRAAGIDAPILVLFRVPADVAADAAQMGVELALSDEASIGELIDRWLAARAQLPPTTTLDLQLEVETGLGRAGLDPPRVVPAMRRLVAVPGLRLIGLWTHMAAATEREPTAAQVAVFERTQAEVVAAGLPLPARHVAPSGAIFTANAPAYEAVRPGLCLYGLLPADLPPSAAHAAAGAGLRPAMQLRARPLRIEAAPVGAGVSYGSHWRAERPSLIATLPVGYSDGWPRYSWPGGEVLVHGRRAPLVGTVAMDALMVDVTDVPGVNPASEFTLLGRDGPEEISAHDLARARNTIAWEVIATMAQRLPRVYHAGPVLVGRRTLAGETDDGVTR